MADCPINPLQCVKDVGKYIVTEGILPPVNRHFYYWWCLDDNIQCLREEIRNLKQEKLKMDQEIEKARLRAEIPRTEIQDWLEDCTQKLEEATRISQGCHDLKVWNIFSRYSAGKNANKIVEVLEKLQKVGKSTIIADPVPPTSMLSIPHEPTMEFDSRRRIEEDIMECLNDIGISMIAICGPGGVGKTTMVQRIEDRARKDKLFDEILTVVVSQQIEMLKIQKEVAEKLSLQLSEETLDVRAGKLYSRLMDKRRKLIIFDDVWEKFNLREIGVPLQNCSMSCKIILTSRVKDACERMNAQKIITLEVLTKEEAWTLFKEKAGNCVEDSKLRPIAEDVAAECNGLPVALVTVGEALRGQTIHEWKTSRTQLRKSIPTDFPEVLIKVYKPLKLSYDYLKNKNLEHLFLLCCLFPEDYDIPTELLALYGIGLGIFEGIENIEEGRCRTYSFVERLKRRFLLMNAEHIVSTWDHFFPAERSLTWNHYVKMHDVVRDVAIFVGSKEKHGFLKSLVSSMDSSSEDLSHDRIWMSLNMSIENTELSFGSDFPNLRLLIILNSTDITSSKVFDVNDDCFKGMEKLNVLSFSRINLGSLSPTLEVLKGLTTLYLHECRVKDISVVGELENLEILCIQDCYDIGELPTNIRKLNRLRFLELSHCIHLTRIVAGVLSSLHGLEELKIHCSNFKWEHNGNQSEENNASLSELDSLCNLTSLEICLSDHSLVAHEICLSRKLVKYQIYSKTFRYSPSDAEYDRNIKLDLPKDIKVAEWIHQLVRRTQSLELRGDGSNNFDLAEAECLRKLRITVCSTMKILVNAINCKLLTVLEHLQLQGLEELESIIPEGSNPFQKLESLIVHDLPKLRYLWKSLTQNVLLGNLISISIEYCGNLGYLFSVATRKSLVQSQPLDCYKSEQVLLNEMESNTDASTIELPKLQKLHLSILPKLTVFFEGVEIMNLPQLTTLRISSCPEIRAKIRECPNLRTIDCQRSGGLVNLLLAHCIRNLQKLEIVDNDIEEIFLDEIRDEGERHIIFQALMKLTLENLPCLTTFCRGVESIKFPMLEEMHIGELGRMNSLLPIDSEANHDHHCLHFFCNPKVEIRGLKTLCFNYLQSTISKIWCRRVPINFFHNLEELHLYGVNGIGNSMSSSIAKNFVNLHSLCVDGCQEMVVVVEDEKEVFFTSPFPNLERLMISNLPKLRSFCCWENDFEFPSLFEVEISECPGMETFTLGYVRAPNLLSFSIDGKDIETKGLNDGLRDHFRTKVCFYECLILSFPPS